jgi:hypothetical protein
MAKIGEQFVDDMIDRGRREIGGFFFPESNIAQQMYPLRGGFHYHKDGLGHSRHGPSLAERLQEAEVGREDLGHDEPDVGIDRE